MKILSIETSCDETAVAVLEFNGKENFTILSEAVNSQIEKHKEYGGVFPDVAKREHSKHLPRLVKRTLDELKIATGNGKFSEEIKEKVKKILERQPECANYLLKEMPSAVDDIDYIAVTNGPGLIPALWIGVNIAQALSIMWGKEIIPINHMKGHIVSSLVDLEKNKLIQPEFPLIALLVSGGHTELVLIEDSFKYKKLGETRDDAAGESFDKVARMLDLPYPGGPEISKISELSKNTIDSFPRPMLKSNNLDFSFSGLKTAVRYCIEKIPNLTEGMKADIANEFQNAVIEVLVKKTRASIDEYMPKGIVLGGGVSANKKLRKSMEKLALENNIKIYLPPIGLSTDNAVMIALAAYVEIINGSYNKHTEEIQAKANISY